MVCMLEVGPDLKDIGYDQGHAHIGSSVRDNKESVEYDLLMGDGTERNKFFSFVKV